MAEVTTLIDRLLTGTAVANSVVLSAQWSLVCFCVLSVSVSVSVSATQSPSLK
jgi:hypothetical protein